MMNNYIGLMMTAIVVMAVLIIVLAVSFISLHKIYRAEHRVSRMYETRNNHAEVKNAELYEDCKIMLAMIYELTLGREVDIAYKSEVIRSTLCLLGIEHGKPYTVGVFQSLMEEPNIDQLNMLVSDIMDGVYRYDPTNSTEFVDTSTFTALQKFEYVMNNLHTRSEETLNEQNAATNEVLSDPVYREIRSDRVKIVASERAMSMLT